MLPLSAAFAEKLKKKKQKTTEINARGHLSTAAQKLCSLLTITWKTLRVTPAFPSASVLGRTYSCF